MPEGDKQPLRSSMKETCFRILPEHNQGNTAEGGWGKRFFYLSCFLSARGWKDSRMLVMAFALLTIHAQTCTCLCSTYFWWLFCNQPSLKRYLSWDCVSKLLLVRQFAEAEVILFVLEHIETRRRFWVCPESVSAWRGLKRWNDMNFGSEV